MKLQLIVIILITSNIKGLSTGNGRLLTGNEDENNQTSKTLNKENLKESKTQGTENPKTSGTQETENSQTSKTQEKENAVPSEKTESRAERLKRENEEKISGLRTKAIKYLEIISAPKETMCKTELLKLFGISSDIKEPLLSTSAEKKYCRRNEITCCNHEHIFDSRKAYIKGVEKMRYNLEKLEEMFVMFKGPAFGQVIYEISKNNKCQNVFDELNITKKDFISPTHLNEMTDTLSSLLVDLEIYVKRQQWFYGNMICTICNPLNHQHFELKPGKSTITTHISNCSEILEMTDFEIRVAEIFYSFINPYINIINCINHLEGENTPEEEEKERADNKINTTVKVDEGQATNDKNNIDKNVVSTTTPAGQEKTDGDNLDEEADLNDLEPSTKKNLTVPVGSFLNDDSQPKTSPLNKSLDDDNQPLTTSSQVNSTDNKQSVSTQSQLKTQTEDTETVIKTDETEKSKTSVNAQEDQSDKINDDSLIDQNNSAKNTKATAHTPNTDKAKEKPDLVQNIDMKDIIRLKETSLKCYSEKFSVRSEECIKLCTKDIEKFSFPVDNIFNKVSQALELIFEKLAESSIDEYYKKVKNVEFNTTESYVSSSFYAFDTKLHEEYAFNQVEWIYSSDKGIAVFADHMSKKYINSTPMTYLVGIGALLFRILF